MFRWQSCWWRSCLLLPAIAVSAHASDRCVLEVAAGEHDRNGSPVFAELPDWLELQGDVALKRVDTGNIVPAQFESGPSRRLWWILQQPLRRNEIRRYEVVESPTSKGRERSNVSVQDDGEKLVVKSGQRRVLAYNHQIVPSPDATKPYYARSGYLHPLFTPSGQMVTDGMPLEHTHQHGVMFAWRQAEYEGRKVDFWNVAERLGRVEHESIDEIVEGPVFGGFRVSLRHLELKNPSGPTPVIRETWEVRVFALGDSFLWDLTSEQRMIGAAPLTIPQFHYGGMMVRGSADWEGVNDCGFVTSLGGDRITGNHTRPRWVAMHGAASGPSAGLVVMCHPKNFRDPQPVRLHPSLPYFCFAPMVLGEFELTPDKPFRLQYRFIVHDGPLDRDLARSRAHDYETPLVAQVVR